MWHLILTLKFVCILVSFSDCQSAFDANNARLTKQQEIVVERIYEASLEHLKDPSLRHTPVTITSMDNIECAGCVLENSRKSEKCIYCISTRDINNPACESCDFGSSERINYCKQVCENTANDSKMALLGQRKESAKCERCLYSTSDGSIPGFSCKEMCSSFQLGNILTSIIDRTSRMSWLQEKLDLLNGGCAFTSPPPPPIIIFMDASKTALPLQDSAVPQFIVIHSHNLPAAGSSEIPQLPGFGKYDISSSSLGTVMLGQSKVIGTPEAELFPLSTVAAPANVFGLKLPLSGPNYFHDRPHNDEKSIHFPADSQDSVNPSLLLGAQTPGKSLFRPSYLYNPEISDMPDAPFGLQRPSKLSQTPLERPRPLNESREKPVMYKPVSPTMTNPILDFNGLTKGPRKPPTRPNRPFNEPDKMPYGPNSFNNSASAEISDIQFDLQKPNSKPPVPIGRPIQPFMQMPTKRPYETFGNPFPIFEPERHGHLELSLDEQRPTGGEYSLPGKPNSFYEPENARHFGGHHTIYKPQFFGQYQNPLGIQMFGSYYEQFNGPFSEGNYLPLQNRNELENMSEGETSTSTPDTFYQQQITDQSPMEKSHLNEFERPNDKHNNFVVPDIFGQSNTLNKQDNLSIFDQVDAQFNGKRPNGGPDSFHKPPKSSQDKIEHDGQRPMGDHDYDIDSAILFPAGSKNDKFPQNFDQLGIKLNGQRPHDFVIPGDFLNSNTIGGQRPRPSSYALIDYGQPGVQIGNTKKLTQNSNNLIEKPQIEDSEYLLSGRNDYELPQKVEIKDDGQRPQGRPNILFSPPNYGHFKNTHDIKRPTTFEEEHNSGQSNVDYNLDNFQILNSQHKKVVSKNIGQTESLYGEHRTIGRPHGLIRPQNPEQSKIISSAQRPIEPPDYFQGRPQINYSILFPLNDSKISNVGHSKIIYSSRPTGRPGQFYATYNDEQTKGAYGTLRPIARPDTFYRPYHFDQSKMNHIGKSPPKTSKGFVMPQELYQSRLVYFSDKPEGSSSKFVKTKPPVRNSGQLNIVFGSQRDQPDISRSLHSKNDAQDRDKDFVLLQNQRPVSQLQEGPVNKQEQQEESMIGHLRELQTPRSLIYNENPIAAEENKLFDGLQNIPVSNERNIFRSESIKNQNTGVYAPDSGQYYRFDMPNHNEEHISMSDSSDSGQTVKADSTDLPEGITVNLEQANNIQRYVFDQKVSNDGNTIDLNGPNSAQENFIFDGSESLERQHDKTVPSESVEKLKMGFQPAGNQNSMLDRPTHLQSAHSGRSNQDVFDRQESDRREHVEIEDASSPDQSDLSVDMMPWNSHYESPMRYGDTDIYIV